MFYSCQFLAPVFWYFVPEKWRHRSRNPVGVHTGKFSAARNLRQKLASLNAALFETDCLCGRLFASTFILFLTEKQRHNKSQKLIDYFYLFLHHKFLIQLCFFYSFSW